MRSKNRMHNFMKQWISRLVVMTMIGGMFFTKVWAEEAIETFDDTDFSYIFRAEDAGHDDVIYKGDTAMVRGGESFGEQYMLVKDGKKRLITYRLGEHLDMFGYHDCDSTDSHFFVSDRHVRYASEDGLTWTKATSDKNDILFRWDGGYQAVNRNAINIPLDNFEYTFLYMYKVKYFNGYYYWACYPEDDTPFLDHAKLLRSKDLKNWTVFLDEMHASNLEIVKRKDGSYLAYQYTTDAEPGDSYQTDLIVETAEGKGSILRTESFLKIGSEEVVPLTHFSYNAKAGEFYSLPKRGYPTEEDAILYVSKDKESSKWTAYNALELTAKEDQKVQGKWRLLSDGSYEIICDGSVINVNTVTGEVTETVLSNGRLTLVYDEKTDRTYGYDPEKHIYRINDFGAWERFSKVEEDYFKYAGYVDGVHYAVTAKEDEGYKLQTSVNGFEWQKAASLPSVFKTEEAQFELTLDRVGSYGFINDEYWLVLMRAAEVSKLNDGVLLKISIAQKSKGTIYPQFFQYKNGEIHQLAVAPKTIKYPTSSGSKYFHRGYSHYVLGKVVTTGIYGTLATSSDGNDWHMDFDFVSLTEKHPIPEFHGLGSRAFIGSFIAEIDNKAYLPIEDSKKMFVTTDFNTYKVISRNIPTIIRSQIKSAYGKYYGVGEDDKLYESKDFVHWVAVSDRLGVSIGPSATISFDRGMVLVNSEIIHRVPVTKEAVKAQAEPKELNIVIDSKKLEGLDVPPRILEGRTLIPVKAFFEAVGAEVTWDGETRTVGAIKEGTEILMTIDSKAVTVNGEKRLLEAPAMIISGRTMVPVRFVSEVLGYTVGWDGETRTVTIDSK